MEISFTQQVKKEITKNMPGGPCCSAAACYGIACFGKYFDARGVVLHTEQAYIAQWAKAVYAEAGVRGKVYVRGEAATRYEFAVKDPYEVEKLLVMLNHTGDETSLRLCMENFNCSGCFAAFVAAAFVCSGVVLNPERGYMLEFVSPRYGMMQDFAALLLENGFAAGSAKRNGANVLYFKASEQIEDLLTIMGAQMCALEIMNQKVYRDHRNRANRITNCETANIDKTIAANRQVLDAIKHLEKEGVLETMPQPLQDAAALRKANPAFSLAELAEISKDGVSKSGLSHRFRKICEKSRIIYENQNK